MSYWTETLRPTIKTFFLNRLLFFKNYFLDVLFWLLLAALLGRCTA